MSSHIKNRISLFIFSLGGGGAEGVCVTLANGLTEQNILVDLIVINDKDRFYLNQINSKVNVISLKKRNVRYALISIFLYLFKSKPKKIIVFNYEILVALLILKRLFVFKFKIFFRNITTFSNELKKDKSLLRKYIFVPLILYYLKKSDSIINQSRGMEKDILQIVPELQKKSVIINNPLNINIELKSKSLINFSTKKENYLLFVGRLSAEKRIDIVLRVFKKFHTIFPDFKLKIVGKGDLYDELLNQVKKLDLIEFVKFEGRQNNLIDYYIKANFTLLTSAYEGFPNVLIESIALGTPVVAFDIESGPKDIIQNGINGFLISNNQEDEMVEKMVDLIYHPIDPYQVKNTAQPYYRVIILKKYLTLLES